MGAALQECAFGVSVQISNFSLEFCAKRNNFPDLDKLFALLFLAKYEAEGAASGCLAQAAVAEDQPGLDSSLIFYAILRFSVLSCIILKYPVFWLLLQ